MSLRTSIWGVVVPLLFSTAPTSAAVAGLEARVTGVRNAKGQVGCLLFASADGFPGDIGRARQAVLTSVVHGAARGSTIAAAA